MSEHKNVYSALAAAQSEMGKALKKSENPHFRSKYADLGAVMDACLPALTANGISVVQPVEITETGERYVRTVLFHGASETSTETRIPLILGKQDMQGLGSTMTYARRYGLMAMAGIAPEDDDGNAAANNAKSAPMGGGLGDAWKDGVLDSLPEDASPREKAEAFAKALCEGFATKGTERSTKALENEWDRRRAIIGQLEQRFPDLHAQVVDAYENRINELSPTLEGVA